MYIGQREDEQREAINESAVEARQVRGSYFSCRSSLQRKGWLNPKIRARCRNLTSFITNKFNIARRVNV